MTDPDHAAGTPQLTGVSCDECGVVLFGGRKRCENCGSTDLEDIVFSERGEIFSFTVQRHPPSKPFRLGSTDEDEWSPRAVGYVDLPEGARILTIIDAEPGTIEIGQQVELVVDEGWKDDGEPVLTYSFTPVKEVADV